LRKYYGSGWDGGAASHNLVYNGGYFEFTVPQNSHDMVVGLSNTNTNNNRTNIEFGIYLRSDGDYRARENNSDVGPAATGYNAGDVFRIEVLDNVVYYLRNGALFYQSANTPTLPLLVDISIQDNGGEIHDAVVANGTNGTFTVTNPDGLTIDTYQWTKDAASVGTNSNTYTDLVIADGTLIGNDITLNGCNTNYTLSNVRIVQRDWRDYGLVDVVPAHEPDYCIVAIRPVVWTDLNFVSATGNDLYKYNSNSWNGGAASYNEVQNNGYFEFTIPQTDRFMVVGLSDSNVDNDRQNIDYGIHFSNSGTFRIRQNGSDIGPAATAYSAGDVFRITVENNVVNYYQNGSLHYTSAVAPTLPLIADVSIQTTGGAISDAVIGNGTTGTFSVTSSGIGTINSYEWFLNGASVGTNSTYTNTTLATGDELYVALDLDGFGCSQISDTITILEEDLTAPTANCKDITIELDATGIATIAEDSIDNNSTDACGAVSFDTDDTDFDCASVGTQILILTVTDLSGNTATCTSTATINDSVDPVANCKDITIELDATGVATIAEDSINNNSTDACGSLTFDTNVTSFDCTSVGTQTLILTVTDASGNAVTCTSTATINDSVDPVADCKDITIELDATGVATISEDSINNN
ncbi:MAG: hypothetical protein AAFO94_13035, partial [Bacteroidota bacterium]